MKTLIVEDDFITRRIIKEILTPYGSCDTVVDGLEAVQAFRMAWEDKKPYDLICMDIMMPNVDGQEALRRIREMEKRIGIQAIDEVKVIMISALSDSGNFLKAYYKGGATSYIVKPIEVDILLDEIRQLGLIAAEG